MSYLKIGQKVKVTGKDVQGLIAFVGPTNFAPDTWIGVKLDEPKGKNNGTVQGVEYFKVSGTTDFIPFVKLRTRQCEDKHGLFVKPSQIIPLDDHGKPVKEVSEDYAKARTRPSR
jgi:dynactin 1